MIKNPFAPNQFVLILFFIKTKLKINNKKNWIKFGTI